MRTSHVGCGISDVWACATRSGHDSVPSGHGGKEPRDGIYAWAIWGFAARQRGAAILERMATRKTVCLKRLGGNRRGEERVGRFFGNDKVTVEKIVAGWSALTPQACRGRHVLAVQDTTEVKFPTTAQHRRGLGKVKKGRAHGLLVHAMIAVDADSGACLGLVGGELWNRTDDDATPDRDRPLSERESARWVNTAEQAKTVLQSAAMVTVIDDREADIYAKWALVPGGTFHLLTRAQADRRLEGGGRLFGAADGFVPSGRRQIDLPARQPDRAARTATVELRFGEVTIWRPKNEPDHTLPDTVGLRLIEVRETQPPEGVEAVHWRLLTTHRIADAAGAWQLVDWYRRRWVIEQMFRALKTQGLRLEDSQVETADRLLKLAAVATKAACIDIQLTQERDGKDGLPATHVFSEPEIATIEALIPTLQGSTPRQRNTHPVSSLARAAWVIARLGGWNCYYKPPGPITFRRGMEQFGAIHRGRMLVSKPT